MNNEKKIAKAILDAQKMREESYVPDINKDDGKDIDFGEYTKDLETCLIATCKQQSLSLNLWCLLNLAMHWHYDIKLWAEDVLAGKNILDECIKENAQIMAEQKTKGEMVDELCANDNEKMAAELTAMNDALKNRDGMGKYRISETGEKPCCNLPSKENCKQCRETDSDGNLKGQIN